MSDRASARCAVHPEAASAGPCDVCGREACERCRVEDEATAACTTCLAARDLAAESDLAGTALLFLALGGAWLLFGSSLFGLLLGPWARGAAIAIGALSLAAAATLRLGHPALRWLVTGLAPCQVAFLAALFLTVPWDILPGRGLHLWFFAAQSLLLAAMVGRAAVSAQGLSPRLTTRDYRRLRARTFELAPTPFPFYGAGSVLTWLCLLLAFMLLVQHASHSVLS